jgi:hypothetical protein
MIDLLIGVIGLLAIASPLIIVYSMKHEDPMKVFDTLSKEELNKTSSEYVEEGLIEIPQEDKNDELETTTI